MLGLGLGLRPLTTGLGLLSHGLDLEGHDLQGQGIGLDLSTRVRLFAGDTHIMKCNSDV